MKKINSEDYHDFVIKNGKFIGEFEQMYRKSKEIPWHQNKQHDSLDIKLTIQLLKEYSPFDYICDFGCGLGYFLDILKKETGSSECRALGYDISPTALKKAKKIFPEYSFKKLDLMKNNTKLSKGKKKEKRLFSIRGTLWYVFKKMENVIQSINNKTRKGDFLLISQNFPPLESDFVGKDIIPNPNALIYHFSGYFKPLKTIYLEDKISRKNDNWFIGLFVKK
ncbi:MAG: hypothetical protein COU81_03425 [Candidatus Portnoybacteria bacterium CG10_big_fil_rev_8_21_14_0_10_36_7]|uniref:Methyltransferase domain-containing protein n=1 Tax=Candidatus Portnoybacteria bacterium CG10_big_fil_rev_8_21_14_0_10_36_7 TaxID=1974812 RepID=A0A2M8KDE0_9BACT|nr:MAG: hypothetical protein COU81_03425 [Candidatus Portnoybacteria bacterium CG10_big_fil_rev_8_21_14_0_10_36_7]